MDHHRRVTADKDRYVDIVAISDTHQRHARLRLPASELLIHCGDFSRRGTREETVSFLDWFAEQRAEKVLVGGNWDRFAEQAPDEMNTLCAERNIHWLFERTTEVCGLRIYGAPWTPKFRSMAFNLDRAALRTKWERIPDGLDVLVTHGPPKGLLDRVVFGARVGDPELREAVEARAPRLHLFGHIHEAAGETRHGPTRFVNAASSTLLAGTRQPAVLVLE